MIAERVLGNLKEIDVKKRITYIPFEWFELEKKRISKTAEDGTAIGVAVEDTLKAGDILGETEDSFYAVKVLPSCQIKIHVSTMQEMGRLGFELGNRHLSLKIAENEVRVPYDQPTFEYLERLGFSVESVTEEFTDFIVCKAHGNSHSHDHAAEYKNHCEKEHYIHGQDGKGHHHG